MKIWMRKNGRRAAAFKRFSMFILIISIICFNIIPAAADSSFTASGQILKLYNGPVSSLSSTGTGNGKEYWSRAVIVPVAAGQTISGEFSSDDLHPDAFYIDQYQLVLDGSTPVSVQFNGPAGAMAGVSVYRYYISGGSYTTQQISDPSSYWNTAGLYYIYVRSTILGAYQLSIQAPLAGANANFTVNSGSAKAPHGVVTGSDGKWSQTFDAGSTYQVSMSKTGYSINSIYNINSDTREFDTTASALDFAGTPNADVPEITGLTLDSTEGTAGLTEQAINVTASAINAPDGTMVAASLLTLKGAFAETFLYNYYDYNHEYSYATVSGGQAVLSLPVNSKLSAGYYKVCAQIADSAGTVSKVYTLKGTTTSAPAITGVTMSPIQQNSGQSQTIGLSVRTSDVPDGTSASAILTDSAGNPLNPAVSSATQLVSGNQAELSLATSALQAAGNYKVKITISTATPLVAYETYVINDAGSSKNITGFTVPGQIGTATISSASRTVVFHVPIGTAVTALTPTITISGVSVSPASGTAQNFSSAVTYRVTAADGTEALWKASCVADPILSSEKSFLSFNIAGQTGSTVIDTANRAITVQMPESADLTSLIPTFTVSTGASVSINSAAQTSGTTVVNFRSSVVYTVAAEDGSTADWTVSASSAARNFDISGGTFSQSSGAGITATVTVSPSDGPDHIGTEVVVFELLKDGKEPVSVVFTEKDITASQQIDANFDVTGTGYSVQVFVFDEVTDSETAPASLAVPVLLQ